MSTVEGKKQEKRRALLDAAYELFLERGTSKTSVEDITSRAKVGKGTFYLYFADKGSVTQALLARVSYQLLDNACAAAEQHATSVRKTLFRNVCRVVVDRHNVEAHMVRKRGNLRRRVGSAQKPHANLVEKRNSEPCKAIELLGMHGRTARGVFHLEDIARGMLAPAHDFLGVVTKEHERIAAARTPVAVFLRDFVIDVFAGSGRVVHIFEANPGKVALVDCLCRALEHARIGRRKASRNFRERCRRHMRAALERLSRETRKVVKRKLNRPACSNIRRERAQKSCRYHTHHKPLIKTAPPTPHRIQPASGTRCAAAH